MKWSKSSIKLFRACSLAWKYRYIDKIEGEKVEALDKGTKLHSLFDKFYDSNNLNIAVQQVGLDESFIATYSDHIAHFLDYNLKYKFKPFIRENSYELNNLKGIVDCVVRNGDKNLLLDYKTTIGNNIGDYLDELLLYAYLIQEKEKITIHQVGIFFTKNNKVVIEDVDDNMIREEIELLQNEISIFESLIEKNIYIPQKNKQCFWCGYKNRCPLFINSLKTIDDK